MASDFAQLVKQQADIVRLIGDYVTLKKAGAQNFSGLCPFHKEKTASFSVHATRQFYHCFGCHESGDIFKFVEKIENVTFPEAVRMVAQKFNIPLPKQQFSSAEEAREAKLRAALMEMQERACTFFQEQLRRPEAAAAREYVAGRGLDADTTAKFRIGFAPDSGFLLRDFFKAQYDEELLKASGLFSWKEEAGKSAALYSKFRNRVTFPICNEAGKVIAFTGRRLVNDDKAGPKYLNSPETAIYHKGRVLFNLHLAKEAIRHLQYAIIVEGQMDCISVFAAGFHNVIASSGTAFTEAQARLLGRYARRVVVNFDPDTAGAAATERTLALLVEEDFEIKVLALEAGLDPDLFVRRRGRQAYADALKGATKYFSYLIERARAQFPFTTPEGKQKAINFLLPHVHRVPSRIVRDELAADIAQKLAIDSAVLRQELRQAAATRSETVKAAPEVRLTPAERIILRALSSAPEPDFDARREAHYHLTQESLCEDLAAAGLISRLLAADPEHPDPMSLDLSDHERRRLASVLMEETEPVTPELLEGAISALRRRRLEREKEAVKHQIAQAERQGDNATVARLVGEKLRLDKELAAQ